MIDDEQLDAAERRSERFMARLSGKQEGSAALVGNLSAMDVPDLLAHIRWQAGVIAANHEGADYAEELLTKQRAEVERVSRDLAETRAEAEQLRYERRLLGACRRHLDEIADPEGRYTVEAVKTAGDLAQRIVDEIGHPVTDEPALGPEFRERIAELERELEWAVAERDHALKQIKKPDYEKLVGAYLAGAEPVALQRERMRPVVEAAKAWRAWFPHHDSMFAPENTLIAAVDAYDAKPDGNAPVESPAAPHRFRTGGKQPHNIYLVTPEHPDGVSVGHACKPDPVMARQIVNALNAAQPTTSEE